MEHPDVTLPTPRRNPLRRARPWLLFASLLGLTALVATSCLVVGPWLVVAREPLDPIYGGQGLATVVHPDGSTSLFYDGLASPPQSMVDAGWNHVGDPDSSAGYIFQPYQNSNGSATTKLFHVITPDGPEYDYLHTDVAGEQMNNSFVAVSPDSQWMVSGEWDTMTRLLVFPTPILNGSTSPTGGTLPLAATIHLDVPVVDIQGCTFFSDTRLYCSSDDPVAEGGFPRKALLQVDLSRPLDGADVDGTVSLVGPLPLVSTCTPTAVGSWPDDFEVEGIDYDRIHHALRVEVIAPGSCVLKDSLVYRLRPPS
jgi:hypothetical protein